MRYAELFSGIGGFRKAAETLGGDAGMQFDCVGFSEIDKYATASYSNNYDTQGEIQMKDIIEFTAAPENIATMPDFDLLLGGFPCQAFSLLGKQRGLEDERGKILFSIHELLKEKNPEFIVLENVRNILRHDGGKTVELIMQFFRDHHYNYIDFVVLDSKDFGLPQKRSRIFFVCSKRALEIDLSAEAVISNFKELKHTSLHQYDDVLDILDRDVDQKYYLSEKIKHTILDGGSKNFWSKSQIDLDIARTLTATMVKMHRACQDNYYSDDFIQRGISHKDTPKEVLYKKPVRKLTPVEALKLQGFDRAFYENAINAGVSEHQLYKQAGNALSVNTGYALLHYLFVKCRIQENVDAENTLG